MRNEREYFLVECFCYVTNFMDCKCSLQYAILFFISVRTGCLMDATLPEEPSGHLIGGANFISKQHLYFRKSEFQQERGKKEPERDRTKSAPLKVNTIVITQAVPFYCACSGQGKARSVRTLPAPARYLVLETPECACAWRGWGLRV